MNLFVSSLQITKIGKKNFHVKWKALKDFKLQYKVECDLGTRGSSWEEVAQVSNKKKKNLNVNVENLEPGRTYLVRVIVINEGKEGPPSRPVSVTTFQEDTLVDISLLSSRTSIELEEMVIIGKPTCHSLIMQKRRNGFQHTNDFLSLLGSKSF